MAINLHVSFIRFPVLFIMMFFFAQCSNREGAGKNRDITDAEISRNHHFDSLVTAAREQLSINPDEVRNIVEQAKGYFEPDDKVRRIQLYNLTGIAWFIQSAYEKALDNYTRGLALAFEISDNDRIASFYNNIGIINLHTGNYMDALEHFLKALEYYESLDEPFRNVNTLNNLGMLYSTIENYEMARVHLDKAWDGFLMKSDSIGMAAVYNNRGAMFLKKEQPDSAFYFLDKAIEMALINNNRFGLSGSYIEKAKVFCYSGEQKKALDYFRRSEQVSSEINYQEKLCEARIGIAQAYLEMNDVKQALSYASQGMDIAEMLDNKKLRKEIHQIYSAIYERIGDYKQSLYHKNLYVDLKEKIIDQSKLHQLYSLEIQELVHAKEIQQFEIQRQNLMLSRKNTTMIFITVAFLLVMGGLYLLYHNHRYRQLASHQKMILDLTEKKSRAAVEAEIQERSRIGRELHDGLGQMLSVARLNISVVQQKAALTPERRKELLESAILSVDKAFYELRDISRNLAPSVLMEKGLGNAIKELAEQVNKSGQLRVYIETFGLNGTIDNLIENTFYRAGQEILNNAIKHSHASEIFFQFVRNEAEITMIVEDNGKGFDLEKVLLLNGGGLRNIRSRVENLKGSMFVDTMLNRGTIITIVIPFKEK
ncbi:MAG: hypothetical protein EA361_02005 [Bacteroidetes bacterium]|nr:MAG: hypothetical protein EA361_02005 [Bacteroidota bacterium]